MDLTEDQIQRLLTSLEKLVESVEYFNALAFKLVLIHCSPVITSSPDPQRNPAENLHKSLVERLLQQIPEPSGTTQQNPLEIDPHTRAIISKLARDMKKTENELISESLKKLADEIY